MSADRGARKIVQALESLPEHHRAIIILSDIQGLSYREIAEVLAIPMGTVMSRLHNARKRLRDVLGPGFLGGLLAVVLLPVLAGVAAARPPPPPPPAVAPGPTHVCVYALVILASNVPGPPGDPVPLPTPARARSSRPRRSLPPGATGGAAAEWLRAVGARAPVAGRRCGSSVDPATPGKSSATRTTSR